ncbi:hypothetical protein APSETT444_003706 [Aspergillus pseudonomiae]
MATEAENGRIVQDTDDSTPEPSFYDQKDARQVIGKIISSNFAVMVAGLNGRLGTGGTLLLGATVQCLGYALMFWHPPYPLFMAAFFFTGMGVAFQDAQANAFTITVKNAHRWLGILHAVYGLGTIIAPLIANTIASRTPEWHHYYLIVFCVGVVNILLLAWTFRRGLFRPNVQNAKDTAGSELKATLANRSVWILNGFFFLYAGAEVASGGWIVQFIVSVRHGDPKKVGYIASGFWTGFTVGRVLLADITHKFGERRMVFIYLVLALAMQLMFWIVPSIPVNAVAVFLLGNQLWTWTLAAETGEMLTIQIGFFIGPFYPVGLYVLTEIVPPELHVGAIGFTASLGQAGSAAFPFMTGAIASKAGVQVLQPIMVGLLIGIGIFWAFIPKEGKIRLEDDENGRLAN